MLDVRAMLCVCACVCVRVRDHARAQPSKKCVRCRARYSPVGESGVISFKRDESVTLRDFRHSVFLGFRLCFYADRVSSKAAVASVDDSFSKCDSSVLTL